METDVVQITLDNPKNRNALSVELIGQLTRGLNDAQVNDAVRCVTISHEGGTFCAGADLAEVAREGGPERGTQRLADLLRVMITFPKPIIGIVDGHVRAGGLGLLGACDAVFAGPRSTFALTESRLGLAPAIISLTLTPKIEPRAWARFALSGEKFDSHEAARIGLVTSSSEDPTAASSELINAFRLASPQGLAATKELMNAPLLAAFDANVEGLVARSAQLFASDEAQEGIAAFKEKRKPRWVID